ncbi:MAG: hypothetical protein J0H67_22230 [Rhodospirillales bacterium]|nr:hypothetical protein [Rhodospirillales bacterium]
MSGDDTSSGYEQPPCPPGQHVPPFPDFLEACNYRAGNETVEVPIEALRNLYRQLTRLLPFEPGFYRAVNSRFPELFGPNDHARLASHYERHGVFEGRPPTLYYFPEWETNPLTHPLPNQYFDLLRDAQDALYKAEPDLALRLYEQATARFEKGFNARYLRGDLKLRMFDLHGAATDLAQALVLRPTHYWATVGFRSALATLADDCAAEPLLADLISRCTSPPSWLLAEWCCCNLRLRRYGVAARVLAQASRQRVDPASRDARLLERAGTDLAAVRTRLRADKKRAQARTLPPVEAAAACAELARWGRPHAALRWFSALDLAPVRGLRAATTVIETACLLAGNDAARACLDRHSAAWQLGDNDIATLRRVADPQSRHVEGRPQSDGMLQSDDMLQRATDLLRQRRLPELQACCRTWLHDESTLLVAFKYALQAAVLAGELQPVVMTRPVMNMEMVRSQTQPARIEGETAEARIPRTLIQFWDKAPPPDEIQALSDAWRQFFGPARYTLFNDADAARFILSTYGSEIQDLYLACYHPAMKADFFRLLYLNVFGGFYVDADDELMAGAAWLMRQTTDAELIVVTAVPSEDGGERKLNLNNLFIACIPGHPVIKAALDFVISALRAAARAGTRPSIWGTTGPGALTRGLIAILLSDDPDRARILRHVRVHDGFSHYEFVAQAKRLTYKSQPMGHWGQAESIARGT